MLCCCAQSLSHVKLFATPWTVACQAPLSMGILQARMLERVAMPSSRGSSQPRDQTQVSCSAGSYLLSEPPGKPKNTGVGSLSLLQGIFPTQESNQGLLHCRQILYQLSYLTNNTTLLSKSRYMLLTEYKSHGSQLDLKSKHAPYHFITQRPSLNKVCLTQVA